MSSDRKAVVKNADMSEEMQQDAVDCATQAIEKFNIEKVRLVWVLCTVLYCFLWIILTNLLFWPEGHLFCILKKKVIIISFQDIAAYIKKEFDKKYNPTWHCIVGRNFGSYVTHETKHFIYFYLGQVAILLFKSG